MSDLGTVIGRIRKNKAETAVVRLVEFHGTLCVDIRAFVEGDRGEDVPTKKGIALNVSLIRDLIAALQEAKAEADRRAWGRQRGLRSRCCSTPASAAATWWSSADSTFGTVCWC